MEEFTGMLKTGLDTVESQTDSFVSEDLEFTSDSYDSDGPDSGETFSKHHTVI